LEASWRGLRAAGFPLAFRIEISEAELQGSAISPAVALRAPRLSGSARPWDFHDWQLGAPDGLTAMAGTAAQPTAKLTARSASGAVAVGGDGGAAIWLSLTDAQAEYGEQIGARTAYLWLTLPSHPPETHTERYLALAADLRE